LDYSALEDTALLKLVAGARSEALGALYDRYGRLVYSVAFHVVGDGETAEEITQDVFVRVWEGAASYRPEVAKVSSWIISITRHRAIDELRRRGARPEKNSTPLPEENSIEFSADSLQIDGPEGIVESELQSDAIRRAVETLPPDQRRVLGLAYFRGLSHSQIAEQLGEPLGTIKSRIRIAMQKLRDVLLERRIVDG
jgi:RNA polymerase sigma-70 factor (ECF subfamily)